ncbi:hypothetical protein COW06_03745 [Candidatus Gracilibacteria bacterium CG12_big_fil_rev_8_21_14_0_65_38_15]|nr:MAG: hypothetical protein COW06_03745 [Candidatus Gracilibacteria bacterium CG12_big_fil_rev_8_21_14_0_65_38_15]
MTIFFGRRNIMAQLSKEILEFVFRYIDTRPELLNANWVVSRGEKGIKDLAYEIGLMKSKYPQFDFYIDKQDNALYVDGFLITHIGNVYHVQIYFPSSYPYYPPLPIVLDKEIVQKCKSESIPHNRGIQRNGVALCVIKPDDTVGQPWTPDLSSTTIVNTVAKWLQAYELWQKTGKWCLREV